MQIKKQSECDFFFFLNHVPSMTPALCRGSIWIHWKEFPDSLWVTSSANSFFPSATQEQIAPMLLPSEGEKPLNSLPKTNKPQKASKRDSERFFVLVCKHGLPQYQGLAWTAQLWEERLGKQIPIRMPRSKRLYLSSKIKLLKRLLSKNKQKTR